MAYLSLAIFLITNAPKIISFVKEILDSVKHNHAEAKNCIAGLCEFVKSRNG